MTINGYREDNKNKNDTLITFKDLRNQRDDIAGADAAIFVRGSKFWLI